MHSAVMRPNDDSKALRKVVRSKEMATRTRHYNELLLLVVVWCVHYGLTSQDRFTEPAVSQH